MSETSRYPLQSKSGVIDIEIRKELKSGMMELAILALLSERDMYGYEITQEVSIKSKGKIDVKEGTLYPILYRLEEKEVIKSYWNEPEGRGKPRKYYQLTLEGEEYYLKYRSEWQIVSQFMDYLLG